MSRFLLLGAIPALLALSGCAGTPTLSAIHDPLYRASPHTSTITARANEPDKGIAEIEIDVVEGELTACTGIVPSLVPCRVNAVFRGQLCIFANAKTPVTCAMQLTLGDRRLVTYTTSTRSGSGKTASTGAITYAAGAPLTQAQIGLPPPFNITIPWETVRPVVWHTDAPAGGGTPADIIDVGFFPDADVANYQTFTDGMQPIVLGAYRNTTDQFATNYTFWKNIYNSWAGPAGADAQDCSRTFTGSAATVAGGTDGDAILHSLPFRDCASIALGGSGSTEMPLTDAAWVFTHESGHFLHGLGDEYVGGGNASVSDPPNIYSSQASCQSSATALSISQSFCVQIGTSGMWRMDDGTDTTMEDRVLTSDWRTASGFAVNRRVAKCINGACY